MATLDVTECISLFHNNSASSKDYFTLGVLNIIILTLYVPFAKVAARKTHRINCKTIQDDH